MAKILHVINGEFYAGAERVQDLLAAALPKQGYEVGFACLKSGKFAAARRTKSAPLFDTPMKSRFDFSAGKRLAELARREGYTAFHSHTVRGLMAASIASWKSGLPFVHHVHSPVRRDTENGARNLVNAVAEKLSARRASALIAVSKSLATELSANGFNRVKITVVPNGVPVATEERVWSPPSGVPWVIGMAALFRKRKGPEILLKATEALHRRGVQVRLRLIGGFESPTYKGELQALAYRLGLEPFIDWVDFTKDMPGEFRQMDIFAVPSLFGEGMPMVVLEAMAAGVPVIGTQVEGIPEILADDCGVLVKPNDPDALVAGLAQMIKRGAALKDIADKARTRQRDVYSDTAMAAGVAAIYRKAGI